MRAVMPQARRASMEHWVLAAVLLMGPSLLAQTPALSGRELAGKKLFLQRCSICHMPPLNEPDNPDPQPYGPKLNGFVRNAETEERARRAILNGTLRMPGFQYGLTKEEVETIITYLKVFK